MEVTQAATFLACSILLGLGLIVLVGTAVLINNVLDKYWKPIKFVNPITYQAIDTESKKEPVKANK